MPDEKIEVNYVRWRLGNSYKCKELLASFLTALSLIYAFYLIAVSPPPASSGHSYGTNAIIAAAAAFSRP